MTAEAAKADVWLPVRPSASDRALMLPWIHHIIENDLYDEQFVKHWTSLPFPPSTPTRAWPIAPRRCGPTT